MIEQNATVVFLLPDPEHLPGRFRMGTVQAVREDPYEPDCFQYDAAYEKRLCGVLSLLYDPPLTLVGVCAMPSMRSRFPEPMRDVTALTEWETIGISSYGQPRVKE